MSGNTRKASGAAPRPRTGLWVTVTILAVLAAGGGGWAAAKVLTPAGDALSETTFTYVEVAQGEVGSSISLNAVAEWTSSPVGSNLATGTVTTVDVAAGQEVSHGSVLYTVGLRPVVIAQGTVPAFTGMSTGAAGVNVTQLQQLLSNLGLFRGDIDGRFDWLTHEAVRDWQASLGLERDGSVQARDIIFVPTLPARIALDTTIVSRGLRLSGGEEVVSALPASPDFSIPATTAQSALMPTGTRVEITSATGTFWQGFVSDQRPADDGTITVSISGKDGTNVCAQECETIPVTDRMLLPAKVITVEAVDGLTIPSAALLTKPDGSIIVTDDQGIEHRVTVSASARGMSVIDGVSAGTLVRVPASAGRA